MLRVAEGKLDPWNSGGRIDSSSARIKGRSFMKILNKRGPEILPNRMGDFSEKVFQIRVSFVRPVYKIVRCVIKTIMKKFKEKKLRIHQVKRFLVINKKCENRTYKF
jgi:hypothetical protein